MTALNVNLTVLAGKLHYVTFGVITRNITRLSKTRISHWFIRVFDEPGFLLIRRSLVRAQVEEPPKKAWSQAMFFPFIRHWLSRWGPLGDFLPSNFIELLHVYYTADGTSQEAKSGFNTKNFSAHKMPVCQEMNQQKLPAMAFATNQKSLAKRVWLPFWRLWFNGHHELL